ncbi:dephospho-CoA kinase [Candidatus Peregrinibacteria bacterium]|nr:dephospho-CoA kinase [Candidatus Peregrinibacteria bacterium]
MKKFVFTPSAAGGHRRYEKRNKRLLIGVSGKIGSGKTTFCKILERYGFFHIEADKIVHDLYKKNRAGTKLVQKIFGKKYITAAGHVNRVLLRDYFVEGHAKFDFFLKRLYPLVIAEINKKMCGCRRVAIEFIDFDIPHFRKLIDKLIYIECPERLILKRYTSKKFPAKYIKAVMNLQKKPKKIDLIVNNNSFKKHLRESAKMIYCTQVAPPKRGTGPYK